MFYYILWMSIAFIWLLGAKMPLTFEALKSISTQHLFHGIELMNAFGMQYVQCMHLHLFAALLGMCARAAASKEKNQKSNGSGARRWRQKSLAFKWLFPERER